MTIISATNKQKYLFELMNQIMRIMHIYFRVFPLCSVSFRDTKCAASVKYSQRYTTLWSTNLCTIEFLCTFAPENIHETYDG